MRTIARILAPLLVLAGLMAGAQGTATADVPECDPGDYYALTVRVADLEHQLTRQADRHAAELDAMNTYLLDADERYTFAVNRHAEELGDAFRRIDELVIERGAAQAEAAEERDERLDAERTVARQDVRIARLLARIAALKAAR